MASKVFRAGRTTDMYKRLQQGPIKALYKYYNANNINLAGGLPLESNFPFESFNISLDNGGGAPDSFEIVKRKDLFLNYHLGEGLPPLRDWVRNHVEEVHKPPCEYEVSMTVGSTDAWFQIMNLLNSSCVLFDQYVYGASLNPCHTLGRQAIGVGADEQGMKPEDIRRTVHEARGKGLSVDILYLIPVGHNPMGSTMSWTRKQEIYKVAQELDLIIVEDDAYYYLSYPDVPGDASAVPGVRGLPKSLLSIDTDGRVLRLDTVSKFISPGMRLGWIAGSKEFIAKYALMQSQSAQFPSSVSQSAFLGLVKHWGDAGLNAHVSKTQLHYKKQCRILVDALQEQLTPAQCSFTAPSAGMFLWVTFPSLTARGVTQKQLFEALAAENVIVVPGSSFYVPEWAELLTTDAFSPATGGHLALNPNKTLSSTEEVLFGRSTPPPAGSPSPVLCARLCYAAAPTEKMVQAVQSMAQVVKRLEGMAQTFTCASQKL